MTADKFISVHSAEFTPLALLSLKMEPNYLKVDELTYELAIRGAPITGNADAKRKALRGLFHREQHNRSLTSLENPYTFETDVKEIRESLADITEAVKQYTGESGSKFHRIESRLSHLSGRIGRLTCEEAAQEEIQSSLASEVLSLEGDFAYKLDSKPAPVGTSTPVRVLEPSPSIFKGFSPKVFKWGVAFRGNETPEQIFEFLDRIEELRIARGVSKEALFNSSVDIFQGDALLWFRTVRSSVDSWDELVALLRKEFLPAHLDFEIWEKIRSHKQLFSEKSRTYIAVMESHFSRLTERPIESIRLEHIMHNLHPFYAERLALHEVNSIAQLSTLCKKLEEVKVSTSGKKPRQPAAISSHLFALTCWNCRENGHMHSQCQSPRQRFCFGCGHANVTRLSCPQCSKNAKGAVSLMAAVKPSSDVNRSHSGKKSNKNQRASK